MPKISIIIADDHAVVRQGTRNMLEQDKSFNILAEASNGTEAIDLTLTRKPDILLLDISMPDLNGIEVLKNIKSKAFDQKIVFFTAHSDLQYVKAAIKSNVDGYLTKSIDPEELNRSLKKICEGERVISQDISSLLASQLWNKEITPTDLTPRETEILVFVAGGKSNKEISEELCIAVRTVETHVANILKKLKLANRTQISRYANEKGYVS